MNSLPAWVDGQLLALQRAWSSLDVDPKAAGSIGLVEAHGTATQAGDDAELSRRMTELMTSVSRIGADRDRNLHGIPVEPATA